MSSGNYAFVKHLKDENRRLEKENKILKDMIADILCGDSYQCFVECFGNEERAKEIFRFYVEHIRNKYGTF
jgi:hypothetical protein